MTTKKPLIFIFIFLFCSSVLFMESTGSTVCNEALCASIVSKCTLLKSCECEITPTGCECCKKCFACLEYLQAECCSCVGLCPTNNLTTLQNPKSVVGDIDNNTPKLWDKLMVKDDEDGRWRTFRNTQESNCTIAALSTEMGDTKCKNDCKSMGAASYRRFNDGCCHCNGYSCINYGQNTASCGFSAASTAADSDYETLSASDLESLENEYQTVLNTKSIVDDIESSSRTLWDALTEGDDIYQPWKTYPVQRDTENTEELNCTVAFWQSEMADMKCQKSCVSMGAAGYRWFTDGCCQCIGHDCINYGLNEARCGFSIELMQSSTALDYETLSDQELEYLEAEYGLDNNAETEVAGHTEQHEENTESSSIESTDD